MLEKSWGNLKQLSWAQGISILWPYRQDRKSLLLLVFGLHDMEIKKKDFPNKGKQWLCRGVQTFGISMLHWTKSCLGPHIEYIKTRNHKKKSHNVLSKFMILCWAAVTAVLGCMCPVGHRLDTPDRAGFIKGVNYCHMFIRLNSKQESVKALWWEKWGL